MNISVPKVIGISLLTILALALVFPLVYSPTYQAPIAQTRSGLGQAELVLRLVSKERPHYLKALIKSTDGNQGAYAAWCKLVDENLDLIGLKRDKAHSILCVDAWTNKFNIFFKDELPRDRCSRSLLKKNLPFVIWSSGPNGSNEFGRGDDVVYDHFNQ